MAQIRGMTFADYDDVLALWQATEGIGLGASDRPAAIQQFLHRNPGLSKVAVADGQIVGALLAGHDGRRGYLHHLAVARTHRGRGIGRRLVDACCAELKELGMSKCNVFVFDDNDSGREFWRRLGWHTRPDLCVMQQVLDEG